MSRKRMMGLALLVGALVVFAGGGFTLVAGHMKTGIGLFVLGVLVIAGGIYTVISRSSTEEVQTDTAWR